MEEEREGLINQAGERTSKRRRIEAEQTPQEEDEEEEEEEGDTPPDEDCITDIEDWDNFSAACKHWRITRQWKIKGYVWDVMDEYGIRKQETYISGIVTLLNCAEQHPDELYLIGWMFDYGVGFPTDKLAAAEWYNHAAQLDHPEGVYRLADKYEDGCGGLFPRNVSHAFELYKKAAAMGSAAALFELALYYYEGEIVEEDVTEALKCLVAAAIQGHPASNNWLGWNYEKGWMGCEQDLKMAFAFYTTAVAGGDPTAHHNLARFLDDGKAGEQDTERAVALYRQAAEMEVPGAQCAMGTLYAGGLLGVPKDLKKAVYLYEEAAKNGDGLAKAQLGMIYVNGLPGVVEKNEKKGYNFYWLAVEEGEVDGNAKKLAIAYLHGGVLPADLAKSAQFLSMERAEERVINTLG